MLSYAHPSFHRASLRCQGHLNVEGNVIIEAIKVSPAPSTSLHLMPPLSSKNISEETLQRFPPGLSHYFSLRMDNCEPKGKILEAKFL